MVESREGGGRGERETNHSISWSCPSLLLDHSLPSSCPLDRGEERGRRGKKKRKAARRSASGSIPFAACRPRTQGGRREKKRKKALAARGGAPASSLPVLPGPPGKREGKKGEVFGFLSFPLCLFPPCLLRAEREGEKRKKGGGGKGVPRPASLAYSCLRMPNVLDPDPEAKETEKKEKKRKGSPSPLQISGPAAGRGKKKKGKKKTPFLLELIAFATPSTSLHSWQMPFTLFLFIRRERGERRKKEAHAQTLLGHVHSHTAPTSSS